MRDDQPSAERPVPDGTNAERPDPRRPGADGRLRPDAAGGPVRFPEGFAWGAATAAYQVEGAVRTGGRLPSVWDTFAHAPGAVHRSQTGDVAADHCHRLAEDVSLLADLGVTHYRFSLSWPRVQPEGYGPLNGAGLDFYSRLLDGLLGHGIRPWATLYHWDLPQSLQDAGGWPRRATAEHFAAWAVAVHERLGDRIAAWTTVHDPWSAAFAGYGTGLHAPGLTDPAAAVRASHHLLLAHGLALRALRSRGARAPIGIALGLAPRGDGPPDAWFLGPLLRGAYPADAMPGEHVLGGDLELISAPLDFLDAHCCGRSPGEVHAALTGLHRHYDPPPLYLTADGGAFEDLRTGDGRVHDEERRLGLAARLAAAHRALGEGVDLRGFLVHPLLDCFAWEHGYGRRTGLVHVDFGTQRRTLKDSGRWYAEVTRANAL
ncbi:family 1 glycosylhydrolase [Streptomyces sp. DSM 44917]|uniref:Family 1 glycosylhydrolase n=1 Tax=Streptomyces boetiae TaxID=3075541 RepID=A0ABU2LBT8_9ACTN|nr:family 1 glycosylhydrolase [Streptomyces sp. DSM 44917]MDT0309048.1 family 1 glycosylhydrolase [Streptomyces sp. DSM 44917]